MGVSQARASRKDRNAAAVLLGAGRALDGRVRGLFQRGYAYWRTAESMRGRNESIASAPWNAIAAR